MHKKIIDVEKKVLVLKSEMIQELLRLVKQPSISATGEGIEACSTLMKTFLQECGLEAKIINLNETEDANPFILTKVDVGAEKTVLFYNHYDVQPPEPLEEWISPPFEPEVRDGRIYGRGTADNKGNIVARAFAIKSLLKSEEGLPVNIKWLIDGEEEIGSFHMPEFIQKFAGSLKADGVVWELGSTDWEGRPKISTGLKGFLYVELVIQSAKIDSHSAFATHIPNAAWRLCHALSILKTQDEKILIPGFYDDIILPTEEEKNLVTKIPMGEEELKKQLGLTEYLRSLSGDKLRLTHFFEPTVNISGIQSGYTDVGLKTVIPSKVVAKLDFLLVPNQTHEDIFEKLSGYLRVQGFEDIQLIKKGSSNPARTPVNHPWVKIAAKTAEEVFGKPSIILPTTGSWGPMDSITRLNLPCVSFGIGDEFRNSHAPNESVSIINFLNGPHHVIRFLEEWSKT